MNTKCACGETRLTVIGDLLVLPAGSDGSAAPQTASAAHPAPASAPSLGAEGKHHELGQPGPWDFRGLRQDPLLRDSRDEGRKAETGASVKSGEGICVETQNTNIKSGNDFIGFLVKSVPSAAVTVAVPVWLR